MLDPKGIVFPTVTLSLIWGQLFSISSISKTIWFYSHERRGTPWKAKETYVLPGTLIKLFEIGHCFADVKTCLTNKPSQIFKFKAL